jgi:hypothetical protein
MTRVPARAVGLSLGIALALGLALAAAVAAPDMGLGAPRAASPAKVIQLKRVAKLNGQFVSLSKRVRPCAAARADLRAATAQRAKANRGASRASVAALKAKRRTLSKAVVRLSRAAKRCAVTGAGGSLTRVIPGAGSAGGSGSPSTLSADVRLPDALNGTTLDLSRALPGRIAPSELIVVDVGDLTDARCTPRTVVCLGVDTAALGRAVASLLGANPGLVDLLGIDVGAVTSRIGALLAGGDLGSLLSVVPVGDGLFQLVPAGPLAELAGLANVPSAVIGTLRLV